MTPQETKDNYWARFAVLLLAAHSGASVVWSKVRLVNQNNTCIALHDFIVSPIGYIGGLLAIIFAITVFVRNRVLAFTWFVVGFVFLAPLLY